MSDNKQSINLYVKVCRECLIVLSMFVMVCRTLSHVVLSEDILEIIEDQNVGVENLDTESLSSLSQNNEPVYILSSTMDDMGSGEYDLINSDFGADIVTTTSIERNLSLQQETTQEYITGGTNPIVISAITIPTVVMAQLSDISINETLFSAPQIKITEVRIDGTDEYIELTNRGGDFTGTIEISGAKGGLLSTYIQLGRHESFIVGDSLGIVLKSGYDYVHNQGLSMTDTTARNLQLLYNGEVIDSLVLSSSQILSSDNMSSSREYNNEQQVWQVTSPDHTYNMQPGQLGNPGLVWGLTLFDVGTGSNNTGDTDVGLSTGVTLTGLESQVGITGSVLTGLGTTGFMLTGIVTTGDLVFGSIQITQIYPFGDCIGEHITLHFSAPYQGNLTVGGLGTSDSDKSFDVNVTEPGVRYIVESISNVLSDNVILVSSITLTDAGESLILRDSGGQILDSVIYSSTQSKSASSYTTTSDNIRMFTSNQSPIISTSCSQSQSIPQIGGCRIEMSDPSYTTGLFASSISVSGSLIQNGCTNGNRSVNGTLVESNTCNMNKSLPAGAHRIAYQQYSGSNMICEDEIMFYGAIQTQRIGQTLSTSSSNCSSSDKTYYESLYHKRKQRHIYLTNAVEYVGLTVTNNDDVYGSCDQSILTGNALVSRMDPSKSTTMVPMMSGSRKLIISNIIADGTGNDRDGTESLTIFNDSDSLFDLEGILLVVNNKVVDKLTGSMGVNSFITLTDYFPLPNAGGCVALYLEGAVYDYVCYGKYTDKHLISTETLNLSKTSTNKTSKSSTKSGTTTSGSGSDKMLYTIKSCLKLEEYDLLKLDIREQTLINTAQKKLYQAKVDDARSQYRTKSNELYITYRSINDSKQQYIDRQQLYIDKLRSQIESCSSYSTRITDIYNNNKSYTNTLKTSKQQLYDLSTQITNNYPALTNDPIIAEIMGIETGTSRIITNSITTPSKPSRSRRTTIKQTISHLF